MNQIFKIFVVTFYLTITSQINLTYASHAAGAEMTYVNLGSGNYEITLNFFRDCNGITPSNSMDIQITNECGISPRTLFIYQVGMEVGLETVCPGPFTTCNGGTTYFGYQKWTYRGIVNLPSECVWYVTHGEPARNVSITTINGNGSDLLFVYCMINNTNNITNSSPTFNEDPILNYCVNQTFLIEPAVTDIEKDSLVYELIVPRIGPSINDTVTYLTGYSHTQPLISSWPMTFDPLTGIMTGLPTQSDISIYALLINEYRNGVLIGQVERDVMLSVGNCTNTIPILTGFNGASDYNIEVFANQSNCFFISSVDPNTTNQTTIEYDYSIPGMAVTNSGGPLDTATFCWTPSLADTLQNPYCIRVKVNDGNCPYLGIDARNYYVNVRTVVGVNEINENSISVYPNPFNSEITISSSSQEKIIIKVFDIQGRQVINPIFADANTSIKMNNIEEGIYLLSVTGENSGQTYWKKVVKKE